MQSSVPWKMPFLESMQILEECFGDCIQTIIHEIDPILQEDDEQRHDKIESVCQQNEKLNEEQKICLQTNYQNMIGW